MSLKAPVQLQNALVTVMGLNSTGPIQAIATVQLDSTGGISAGAAGSTQVTVYQSSAAELNMTAVQGSTVWQVQSRELPGQAFTYGQITVNTTAVLICAANANRTRLLVTQIGGVTAYLGASTVVSTSGHLLSSAVGYPVVFRHDDAVYGITAASTTIVSFVEETR